MLKRIRPSVGSAHVIALLALFAALGGGYAVAFSGSGTLQKGSLTPTTAFQTIRSVNGFGNIQLKCDGPNDEVELRFQNTSTNDVIMRFYRQNIGVYDSASISSGADSSAFSIPDTDTTTLHLFRNTSSKAQASADVSTAAAGNACSTAKALVLNSVE